MLQSRIETLALSFESQHPGALHVTTMKYTDGRADGPGDDKPQGEHRAACDALLALARRGRLTARFQKVYVYYLPEARRWAPLVVDGAGADHRAKAEAMLEGYDRDYLPWHLGIGYRSVPALFQNAGVDTDEYATRPSDVR
jgi:hypothetical protein